MQEIDDLFEAGVGRQIVDVVADVEEEPQLPVDIADRGLGRYYALETLTRLISHPLTPHLWFLGRPWAPFIFSWGQGYQVG
jgi:hypothetical protein